jgi:hypothetical protein
MTSAKNRSSPKQPIAERRNGEGRVRRIRLGRAQYAAHGNPARTRGGDRIMFPGDFLKEPPAGEVLHHGRYEEDGPVTWEVVVVAREIRLSLSKADASASA